MNSMDINARLDLEAEADARSIQDSELLRRDFNATFADADRGVPIKHLTKVEESAAAGKSCRSCGGVIHPAILRKAPSATMCYDCYKNSR